LEAVRNNTSIRQKKKAVFAYEEPLMLRKEQVDFAASSSNPKECKDVSETKESQISENKEAQIPRMIANKSEFNPMIPMHMAHPAAFNSFGMQNMFRPMGPMGMMKPRGC